MKDIAAVLVVLGIALALMAVVLAVTEPGTSWRLSGALWVGIMAGWFGRIIVYG